MNTINVFFDKWWRIFSLSLLISSVLLWAYSENLIALTLMTALIIEPLSEWVLPAPNKAKWALFAFAFPAFLYAVITNMNTV